jgi:hypothetical protein
MEFSIKILSLKLLRRPPPLAERPPNIDSKVRIIRSATEISLLSTSLVVLLLSFDCSYCSAFCQFSPYSSYFLRFSVLLNTSLASFSSLNFLSASLSFGFRMIFSGHFTKAFLISASVAFYRPQYFVIVYKCHFLLFSIIDTVFNFYYYPIFCSY